MQNTDYQHVKHNKYWMEPSRYYMALAFIRQYPRLCRMQNDILYGSPNKDDVVGAPKGVKSDPTAQRGLRLERIEGDLSIINKAISRIPQEYRQAVLDNILYKIPRSSLERKYNLSESTLQRWRARLLWEVAELAHIP